MKIIFILMAISAISCKPENSNSQIPVSLVSDIEGRQSVDLVSETSTSYSCAYESFGLQYCDDYEALPDSSISWAVQECMELKGTLTPAQRCPMDNRQSECIQVINTQSQIKVTSIFYKTDTDPDLVMECAGK